MSRPSNAWEDDWISTADKTKPPDPKILTKSERKAQHQEANRKLWDSAEQPGRNHFLEAKNEVPLKTDFKPQMKVLSRKPAQPVRGNTGGLSGLSLHDEEDSEEEERKKAAESLADRQRKAALEREEKQRKYAEARERIMGSPATVQSHTVEGVRSNTSSRQSSRRGRTTGRGSQAGSPAERSPAAPAQQAKQLFDPDYTAKPHDTRNFSRSEASKEQQPVRMPRGPDGSGRGGFALRGGRGG